ncbi:pyridoxamine 5'-phosphate oxidase-like protein [Georgenia soli]|uniref:Pyridoxamine 5'-phosphate oxidase-like protein n=1 Tax=Georgenia soli TaxID=638953 RepID=A0A2A9ELU9_9MICO|nr:pyridoxamine 5'-phosphate oxidase family protein [Georgenia soli]PFG39888.1 pyridoxamine 5'-phosphate oxidase-like protein [Georgenia soli]
MRADQLEELSRDECLRLLREGAVGWVAFPDDDGGAALVPVNYVLHRDELVVTTAYGSKLAAAAQDRVMSFGIGEFDVRARSGWSVVVHGSSRLVGDDLVNPDLPPIDSWAVRGSGVRIAIELGRVSGRRVSADSPAGDSEI